MYESLDYIRRDSAAFARFGVKDLDDLAAIFPEGMRDYVRWGYDWCCVDTCVDTNIIELEAPINVRFEVNAEYPHYYTNLRNWYSDNSYDISNDTLRLFLGEGASRIRDSLSGFAGTPTGKEWIRSGRSVRAYAGAVAAAVGLPR